MCQGERCTAPVPCGGCERGRGEAGGARDDARAELLQLASRERRELHASVAGVDGDPHRAKA